MHQSALYMQAAFAARMVWTEQTELAFSAADFFLNESYQILGCWFVFLV